MPDAATREKLRSYEQQIEKLRREMHAALRAAPPEPVEDYEFGSADGPVQLSKLFGAHDDLIVIHNMGRACAYCTLWADGYNGLVPHLENRASFVVSSPDSPDVQRTFAESRGWRFRMVSHAGTSFAADMGFRGEHGFLPGVSAFKRGDGAILRVSARELGPYDEFCALWHFFDLLADGVGPWRPRFSYV